MSVDKLIELLEKQYKKNNKEFFSYAWRENIKNFIEQDSKYQTLVEWIDTQIELAQDLQNVFNPADKTEDYINSYFDTFKEASMNLAILLNFKHLLLHKNTTTTMRDNIEYSICKIYNIKYNKELNSYI